MKTRKIIVAGLVLLMLLQLLAGCSASRYDAKLYSDADGWVDGIFLWQNQVKGAYYGGERIEDGPSVRNFIITTEEEYDEIFVKASPPIVDFEKQTVILHIETDTSPREYVLQDVDLNEGVLTVKIKLEKGREGVDDAVMPYSRVFMLVMNKTEITEVVFEKVR